MLTYTCKNCGNTAPVPFDKLEDFIRLTNHRKHEHCPHCRFTVLKIFGVTCGDCLHSFEHYTCTCCGKYVKTIETNENGNEV